MTDLLKITVFLSLVAAWLTHVIWSFATASWGFLLLGIVFPPYSIIHGFCIWGGVYS